MFDHPSGCNCRAFFFDGVVTNSSLRTILPSVSTVFLDPLFRAGDGGNVKI